MRHRTLVFAGAVVCLLAAALAPAASGKDKEDANLRSVQGVVTDAHGTPVDGAIVQLKNTKSLQIRSFVTKDHGSYYFHGLSTDIDYELRAQNRNNASPTKTLSTFDSRKKAVINLKLEGGR